MGTVGMQARGTTRITEVSPELLRAWLDSGGTVLVDVREDYEQAEERIDGAVLHALSRFDPEALRRAHPDKRFVFHCRSGKRSKEAADRFGRPDEPVFHLVGGIEGWKAAGLPVIRPERGPRLPLIRQVMLVAGALVAIGVGLGVSVSPWFLALSGFVGCGLMFAGLTGWCGMAKLLSLMPWNRRRLASAGPSASCCST